MRPIWFTWIEGKFPDIVCEVTSPSTQDDDLTTKVRLYEQLGAREYYIYDPEQEMQPPFLGYHARANIWSRLSLCQMGPSSALCLAASSGW